MPYAAIDSIMAHCNAHFAEAAMFAREEDAREAAAEIEAFEHRRRDAVQRRDRPIASAEAGEPIPTIRARLDALTVEIGYLDRAIRDANLRAGREADRADDIETRIEIGHGLIFTEDQEERTRGRAKVNARLRIFLDAVVVSAEPVLSFRFKLEYSDIASHMSSIYGGHSADG